MICPKCGNAMNLHAEKVILEEASRRTMLEVYACSACGNSESEQVSNDPLLAL